MSSWCFRTPGAWASMLHRCFQSSNYWGICDINPVGHAERRMDRQYDKCRASKCPGQEEQGGWRLVDLALLHNGYVMWMWKKPLWEKCLFSEAAPIAELNLLQEAETEVGGGGTWAERKQTRWKDVNCCSELEQDVTVIFTSNNWT